VPFSPILPRNPEQSQYGHEKLRSGCPLEMSVKSTIPLEAGHADRNGDTRARQWSGHQRAQYQQCTSARRVSGSSGRKRARNAADGERSAGQLHVRRVRSVVEQSVEHASNVSSTRIDGRNGEQSGGSIVGSVVDSERVVRINKRGVSEATR
jgi:hypothetical protein